MQRVLIRRLMTPTGCKSCPVWAVCSLFWVFCVTLTKAQSVLVALPGTNEPATDIPVFFKALDGQKAGQHKLVLTNGSGLAVSPFAARCQVVVQALGYEPVVDTLQAYQQQTVSLKGNGLTTEAAVVTGNFGSGPASAHVHNLRVIDRVRIQQMGAVNVRDVLQQELNIRIQNDNVLGSQLSLQGLGGQNVKVLIDNVPVIGRQDGNIDLTQLNLNEVERIELITGPMAVQYGADALGGVINIITRQPEHITPEVGGTFYGESAGHYNASGYAQAGLGPHRLRISGGRNFFAGWNPESRERGHQWKPRTQAFGALDYTYRLTGGSIRARTNYLWERIYNYGAPRVTYTSARAIDEWFTTVRFDQSVNWQQALGRDWQSNLVASFNRYDRQKTTYAKNLLTLEQQPTPSADDHDTSTFDQYFVRHVIARNRENEVFNYQLGYELTYETGTGQRLPDNPTLGNYAGFGSLDIKPIPQLTLRPGVRWAYNTRYDAPVTPSLHARYELGRELSLRGSYAKGFRAPSLKELHFLFVDASHNIRGNENLDAERSDNVRLSAHWRHLLPQSALSVQMEGFYNRIEDRITLAVEDAETQLFRYTNIGSFETHGLNLSGNYQAVNWSFQVGAALTGIENTLVEAPERYSYTPEARVSATKRFPEWGLELAGFYKFNGRQTTFQLNEDDEAEQVFIEAYHLLDVSATKFLWKDRLQVQLGAKNLLNVQNVNASFASGAHSGGGQVPIAIGTTAFTRLQLTL